MKIQELGHVVLYVSNLEQSANFYRDTLGFREIHRDLHTALYSAGRTHHEMLLIEVGGFPSAHRMTPGLYHIGLKIGDSPEDIRSAYKEVLAANVTIVGTADHGVTHSLYILDPDGIEIELYADVSDSWKNDPKSILTPAKGLHLE